MSAPANTYNALIVDDEAACRDNLKILLEEYCPGIHVRGLCESVASAREFIARERPDILFLDVQMPGSNGFSLLKEIDLSDMALIFVTAHDQYALQAIKSGPIDYLLKPIDIDELTEAVKKAKSHLTRLPQKEDFRESLNYLMECFAKHRIPEKLGLHHSNKITLVHLHDILYLEADSSYTTFHLSDGNRIVVAKTMKEYEDVLGAGFIKVHRSYIVNIGHVKEFSYTDGGTILMDNKASIPVSRRRLTEVILSFKLA